MQVCSFDTHFFAHDTPAPGAKQLAKSVWNWAEQAPPPVPAWRQSLKSLLAVRMQVAVASLNGCGRSLEVVGVGGGEVFTVRVGAGSAGTGRLHPPRT